jgi:hypothetical protein
VTCMSRVRTTFETFCTIQLCIDTRYNTHVQNILNIKKKFHYETECFFLKELLDGSCLKDLLAMILPVRGWHLFACVCVCVNLCEKLLENKTFRKILSTFFLFFSSKSAWSCVVAGPIVVVIAAARGISLLEFESVLKIGWCETLRCNSS